MSLFDRSHKRCGQIFQSFIAHFAVGAVKSLITIRSWWASGFEMTMVGVIEAAVT